jgi:hypothetical protein
MTAPNSTTLKFSILLIILLAFDYREASSNNGHLISVLIINRVSVPSHPTTITVHCKSKDNDLGFHTVPYSGSYGFLFTENVIGTTLFFCSFTWPEDPRRHYLDIYDAKHDSCLECIWNIISDGGCLNSHKCGPWKSIDANSLTF